MPRKPKALSDDQISSLVAAANAQLKAANVGLIVFRRGLKLNLRGRLPGNRPGSTSGKTAPHQQTVSLDIMANPAGIEQAKQKAMEWGSLLAQQRFRWEGVLYHRPSQCSAYSEA